MTKTPFLSSLKLTVILGFGIAVLSLPIAFGYEAYLHADLVSRHFEAAEHASSASDQDPQAQQQMADAFRQRNADLFCGNGFVDDGETCDDGNTISGDGCSAGCQKEQGFACHGQPTVCQRIATCGDGVLEGREQCDDGNTSAGDGCSEACLIEPGFTCPNPGQSCQKIDETSVSTLTQTSQQFTHHASASSAMMPAETSQAERVSPTLAASVGTSHSSSLSLHPRTRAEPSSDIPWQPAVVAPTCGNGFTEKGEDCDDGNRVSGDGCSQNCTIEKGYSCDDASKTICSVACGNGIVTSPELCDDGNILNHDGCSAACRPEPGWACKGQPSICINLQTGTTTPESSAASSL